MLNYVKNTAGLLQRGDGSTLDLKALPRLVKTLLGDGTQRPLQCPYCAGLAIETQLLTPSALASGPDGSVYVGDFNLVRRVTPEGMVYTILQLRYILFIHFLKQFFY